MSNISKRRKDGSRPKIKSMGDHKEFLKRITKTLYYGQLPSLPCLSLPVTEISCEAWSAAQRGRSLRRLHADCAADVARAACVSPCALVLALLYLERLNARNPNYVANVAPNELFLVSLMVGNKFLQDDGEDDDVMCSEWAASGGMETDQLKKLEVEFLNAIDWNVYVSEESFETGLRRLERRVALRQAQGRGFFTYGDLAAAGSRHTALLARELAAACALLALGSLTGLLALLAAHACLTRPAQPSPPTGAAPATFAASLSNDTMDGPVNFLPGDEPPIDKLTCCTKWTQFREADLPEKVWSDPRRPAEPWSSTATVLNWLYQSSLVNPVQRWLERMNEYAKFLKYVSSGGAGDPKCGSAGARVEGPRCVRQRLNFSKLSSLMVSVSDR